jgi:ORF6N domain
MEIIPSIQNRIYKIRGERVMLDFDLAELYEVSTKALNQAVKRNNKRFPEDFMFQLDSIEWLTMRSQSVTASQNKRNTSNTPFAFTEHGVAMLSGVLNSEKAINMNIAIMRAFIEIRRIAIHQIGLRTQLQELKEKLGEHDIQLNQIYDAMENLLDEKAVQIKWDKRERIGFNKQSF